MLADFLLADFYIPKLSNDMKIVKKNHLWGQILDLLKMAWMSRKTM